MVLTFSLLCGLNMHFQSFGPVAIVKVNSPWFHVRERGMFAAAGGGRAPAGAKAGDSGDLTEDSRVDAAREETAREGTANEETASEVVLVLSTFAAEADAVRAGRELVERRLAACVNVVPGVRSIYRWQGRIEDAGEVLAIVKTQRRRLGELVAALAQLHPYAVPEIVAVSVTGATEPYARWVRDETAPA